MKGQIDPNSAMPPDDASACAAFPTQWEHPNWLCLRLCCFQRLMESTDSQSSSQTSRSFGKQGICLCPPTANRWQHRWIVFPKSMRPAPSIALACSHYRKRSDWEMRIRDACRTWLIQAARDPSQAVIVTGAGMTLDLALTTLAPRLQLTLWRFHAPESGWEHWWQSLKTSLVDCPTTICDGWISPPPDSGLAPTGDASSNDSDPFPDFSIDAWVLHLASRLSVLYVRPGSKTYRISRARLSEPLAGQSTRVWICDDPVDDPIQPRELRNHRNVAHQLMDQGAIGWYLPHRRHHRSVESASLPESYHWDQRPTGEFLYHHTRATRQAWPEETNEEYWMRWLTGGTAGGPLETLIRILTQQQLRGGGHLIPGSVPMVCFSQRCPVDTVLRRTFRSHLGRWDYEPYGVAIRKSILIQQGAQPVHYVDPDVPPANVPLSLTQKRYTQTAQGPVDWSEEQEYRYPGNLSLKTLTTSDLFAFVPTEAEAETLSTLTHWPVVVLPSGSCTKRCSR